MPCLGNSPAPISTWQRPQMPRPPHTESRSTPSRRAASRTLVPDAKRPRRPEGVKTTRKSSDAGTPAAFAPSACALGGAALGRGLAELADPGHAIGIMTHHDVGAEHGLDVLGVQRVHD